MIFESETMEHQLVAFLRETYQPHVIALAGSRADKTATETSDWDLFLFGEKKYPSEIIDWNGHELDLTFHEWPKPEGWVFTNPYAPIWPVKILFDDTQGTFEAVMERTKNVFDQSPQAYYQAGCIERKNKLRRWLEKLEKYRDNPEVQFYYAGIAYEALIRVWFEQRNLWPLPPAKALPFIRDHDAEFWKLLKQFSETRTEYAGKARRMVELL